jgi:hypothetical protein
MAQIRSKPFGVTKEGANVTEYILSNPGGLTVSVLDYGCVIKNIIVPAKNGPVDVVLGHDTMADYENDFTSSGSTCCGAFVGRYANRIENAVFTLGGKTYQLEKNNGENHLHGCFSRKIYEVKYFGDTLLMEAESPDGEDGFPGNLKLAVRYTLTEDNFHRLPLVLTEGLTHKEISLSAEDSQLLEARKFQVIDIARAFGVPPHMIGETSASTSWGSGIEAMSRGFVTYTLQPHLVRIEQELNRKLFPRNPTKIIAFDRDALIEGDSKAQAEYNRAALGGPGSGMGWMTVDEIRKSKGLAPLGGKAAELFDPNAAKPQPAAQPPNEGAPA